MYMVKLLSLLVLGVYFVLVGLQGVGVVLGFVTPGVLGFLALVGGVLLIVRAVKAYTCGCCKSSCDKPYDNKYDNK